MDELSHPETDQLPLLRLGVYSCVDPYPDTITHIKKFGYVEALIPDCKVEPLISTYFILVPPAFAIASMD